MTNRDSSKFHWTNCLQTHQESVPPRRAVCFGIERFDGISKEYHNPERSIIVESFKFNSCIFDNGESVANM